ncbi:glycosyltransferase family 4 protein [Cellulomonas soli]|uniref:Glycosyl transferase n=1 Tax=Cellulomonas soli TaxID=931535 RepID=A0A512P7Z5_9CELL|nr:glycosyltransferase family 1 protein [Cellulomonas soli]NYI57544.1 glycosyltransferase involved in cell wall biosynthesis [Cellulomonas soli]GEP67321.1 glycosyl transferase [Cellulomonas soli]
MKVLVDATAVPADRGGVGRYVDAVLPALARLDVELVVVAQARDRGLLEELLPSGRVVAAPTRIARRPARLLWEQVGLPRLARAEGVDVLLSPHYTMPWRAGVPVVVTLHDATFFSHPHLHSSVKARFFRVAIRRAVRRAAAVVVPSRATADEVARFTGASPDVFHVAHHGVDTALFHPVDDTERARVRATLGVEGGYVAFLGTLEPRKNVPALVRGWVRAVSDRVDPPALVLAGGRGWDTEVDGALAEVPAHLDARRVGYLPFADLPGFLSGADLVAYPSLGEGFGLPVLEAMACGAAVLTSRELSLPEVGGDAVAYTGTGQDEIAQALGALLEDPESRRRLARAGVARAATFTWDAAARVHLAALEAAVLG